VQVEGVRLVKRIVVGVDGSAGSMAALAWAVDEARAHDATLACVVAWEPPVVYGSGFAPVPSLPPDGAYEDAARSQLDGVLGRVLGTEEPPELERLVVEGPPGEVLLAAAAGADLLVVGSRGHGSLVGMLLGSVSQHCVHHAHCPVVIIPNPER
jgi:nucleotide-binding universal stress UspA family protein